MINTLLGSKSKMSQTYVNGVRVPVTLVKVGPCFVTQIKSMGKDGYWGIQLGFGERKVKNTPKPLQGHLKNFIKDGKTLKFIREVRVDEDPQMKVGDEIKISDIFSQGDLLSVSGISKGKGFAGVVKRWHFRGGPKTHGQSDRQRAPGSIGQTTTPGRVLKGKKMGGRMGSETKTIKNLVAVSVDAQKNELAISGSIPGKPGSLIVLKKIASGKLGRLTHENQQVEAAEDTGAKIAGSNEAK
jgi:large subunit ribosomal protein L3